MLEFKNAVSVAAIGLLLSGCVAHGPTHSQSGAVIGGITGGVIGNQIGSGSGKTVATALGAVVGAMTGAEIGRTLDPNSCYTSPYGTVIVRGPCPYTGPNRYRYGLPPARFPECEVYPTYGERRACHAGVMERERANQQSYNSQAYQNGKAGYHP